NNRRKPRGSLCACKFQMARLTLPPICFWLASACLVFFAAVDDAVAQSPPLIPQLPHRPSNPTSGTLGAAAPTTTAGRTPGSFAVSNSGAATYTIPIWAPPGVRGLEPHIALVYDSHGAAGFIGVGWSLAGLSVITRCNKTYAQDAAPAAIALSYSDMFCLDG